MESREFFRRARKLAAEIGQPFVVVSSKETTDGGREGVLSQVSRETAARLILKDLAVLATAEQTAEYFAADERTRASFEAEQLRNRIHVALANNHSSDIVVGFAPVTDKKAAEPASKK
jgi:hypothetical protein